MIPTQHPIQCTETDRLARIETNLEWLVESQKNLMKDCAACPVKAEQGEIKVEVGKDSVYRKLTWLNLTGMLGAVAHAIWRTIVQ